jgi:hypothetical protein
VAPLIDTHKIQYRVPGARSTHGLKNPVENTVEAHFFRCRAWLAPPCGNMIKIRQSITGLRRNPMNVQKSDLEDPLDTPELFDQSVPEVEPIEMDTPEQRRSESAMLRRLIIITVLVVVAVAAVLLLSNS